MPADVRLIKDLGARGVVLELPRYYAFRIAATALATQHARLTNIASNRGSIFVTLWTRDAVSLPTGARVLFEQSIVTMPVTRRVAALIPVKDLSDFLLVAASQGATVEHIYDY